MTDDQHIVITEIIHCRPHKRCQHEFLVIILDMATDGQPTSTLALRIGRPTATAATLPRGPFFALDEAELEFEGQVDIVTLTKGSEEKHRLATLASEQGLVFQRWLAGPRDNLTLGDVIDEVLLFLRRFDDTRHRPAHTATRFGPSSSHSSLPPYRPWLLPRMLWFFLTFSLHGVFVDTETDSDPSSPCKMTTYSLWSAYVIVVFSSEHTGRPVLAAIYSTRKTVEDPLTGCMDLRHLVKLILKPSSRLRLRTKKNGLLRQRARYASVDWVTGQTKKINAAFAEEVGDRARAALSGQKEETPDFWAMESLDDLYRLLFAYT